MRPAPQGGYEATRFQQGDHAVVAKQNQESTEVHHSDIFRDHRIPLGREVFLGNWDSSDGTWQCSPVGVGSEDYVHEDCLESIAPSKQDLAEAIASITGQPVPATRKDEDGTVAFLQGYVVMGLTKDWTSGNLPLKVHNIEQLTGPDDIYENHCTVVTESGKRIRITFEEDA